LQVPYGDPGVVRRPRGAARGAGCTPLGQGLYYVSAHRGGIAQLGERDAGSVEARGSSPLTSTS
jgi:hypothetical protein